MSAPGKAPDFWYEDGLLPRLLAPFGWMYRAATARRLAKGAPFDPGVPVICVGNLTAGGSGKTPVVRDLAARLRKTGHRPHIVTRGYGGTENGPHLVDPERDGFERVGDEAKMLAQDGPVWVGNNRQALAMAAVTAEADVLIQDDGYQDPALKKSLSLVCVDSVTGFGNGRMIPAGPLREPVDPGLRRADAVILTGSGTFVPQSSLPLLRCHPVLSEDVAGVPLAAFCGLGLPDKFFESLRQAGADLAFTQAFPDHHPFHSKEISGLMKRAADANVMLATTEKDAMRLDSSQREAIRILTMALEWENDAAIDTLLTRLF